MNTLIRFVLGFALLLLPIQNNNAQNVQFRYHYSIEVPNRSQVTLRQTAGWLVANGFDVAGVSLDQGRIDVITDDAGIQALQARGLRGYSKQVLVAGAKQSQVDARYYNPEKIEAKLKQIQAQYPKLTQLLTIGKSIQNRPIFALVLSTTPNVDQAAFHQKPTVLFDAMHHAREIMTPEVVMDIAESLLTGAQKGAGRAREVLTQMNVVVVPMLNVDGNSIVWASDNMWRKNAHKEGNNTFGVDINRNYPYRFAGCNGSSGSKGAQDYRGESGASEPETQALMALAEKIRPMGSISYHS
jgi:murein tripeptide amidase MpaA